jgi:microcystin-dependent protein
MSMITPYALNFAIRDWSECRGQLLSISQMSALYSLLGATFGGDAQNSFGLPNMQSRSPVSFGHGPGLGNVAWGQMGGRERITLSPVSMSSHNHEVATSGQLDAVAGTLNVSTGAANTSDPDSHYLGVGSGAVQAYTTTLSSPPGTQADAVTIPARNTMITGSTQMDGGSQAFDSRNPYLGVNYQICTFGLYPSRN